MATEIERLVAVLETDITRFSKGMADAQRAFDSRADEIERRQNAMVGKLNSGWKASSSGATLLGGALRTLLPYLSVAAVLRFAGGLLQTADTLQDTSEQLGLTTQDLQGLQSAARDTGAGSDRLTQALGTMTQRLGDAQKGEGDLAKRMRELGIPLGTTMQVLFDLADAVQKADTQEARMAITTDAFGKAGRALVPILQDGAAGLRAHLEAAQAKGQIWDPATVKQLDAAKDAFERLKVSLSGQIASPLANIIADANRLLSIFDDPRWRIILAMTPFLGIATLPRPSTTPASGFDSPDIRAVLAAQATAPRTAVPLSTAGAKSAQSEAEKAIRLEQQRREAVAKTLADAIAAEAELTKVIGAANVERLKDTIEYYAAATKAANDDAAAEIAAIQAKETQDIGALKRRELGETAYAAAVANIQRAAAAREAAINAKRIADIEKLLQVVKTKIDETLTDAQVAEGRNVQLLDGIRGGLEDVGVAALHGGEAFKEALANMLIQLAELYFRLKVLEPLMDRVLGRQGSSDSGIIGDIIASIGNAASGGGTKLTGKAVGGPVSSGTPYVVGERGAEVFVPNVSGKIMPRIPAAVSARSIGPPQINMPISVSVAANGDETIVKYVRQGVAAGIKESVSQVKQNFGAFVRVYQRDTAL